MKNDNRISSLEQRGMQRYPWLVGDGWNHSVSLTLRKGEAVGRFPFLVSGCVDCLTHQPEQISKCASDRYA